MSLLTCPSTAPTDTSPVISSLLWPCRANSLPPVANGKHCRKGAPTLRRFPGTSRQSQDPRGRGAPWRSCHLKRQKILADAPPCLQLPTSRPWRRECPTPCLGPSCTLSPATPIPLTLTLERWVLGFNWLNTASTHPLTQIRNDLDSGEDGRKVLEKQDLKVLVPGPRKEGANWASLVIAIARSWSQGPWLLSDLSRSSCHLGGGEGDGG